MGKSLPADGANRGKLSKAELGQTGETVEGESAANGLQGRGGDAGDVRSAGALESTGDLLDTRERQVTRVTVLDGHITTESGAAGNTVGIALRGDGQVTACCITTPVLANSPQRIL